MFTIRRNRRNRLALIIAAAAGSLLPHAVQAEDANVVPDTEGPLGRIERKLVKEPAYEAKPQYALLALGPKAKWLVWLVEDGKRLFVDRNGNGDLTDDGPPTVPSDERHLDRDGGRWDFAYKVGELLLRDKSLHTDLVLRRWNYADDHDSYGLSIKLDDQVPMYAGWFLTFWSDTPEKVPIIHFGGALQPRLLGEKTFRIGGQTKGLSVALINPGLGEGVHARLSIDALPMTATPVATINWPVKAGAAPVRTTCSLTKRCCYWEFYDDEFQPPPGIEPGMATLEVSLQNGEWPLQLATNRLEVPVQAMSEPSE